MGQLLEEPKTPQRFEDLPDVDHRASKAATLLVALLTWDECGLPSRSATNGRASTRVMQWVKPTAAAVGLQGSGGCRDKSTSQQEILSANP